MDENLVRWLSLSGVALFVILAVLLANRINRQAEDRSFNKNLRTSFPCLKCILIIPMRLLRN